MSKEKQIEEMANTVYDNRPHKDIWLEDAEDIAKVLYEAGYRKQSEGEWARRDGFFVCSVCDTTKPFAVLNDNIHYYACNYCHKCGAKMKGGGE